MTLHQELVTLIETGTPTVDIYYYFSNHRRLSRASIIGLLEDSGVHFRLPDTGDEISDARRLELQLLSISDL